MRLVQLAAISFITPTLGLPAFAAHHNARHNVISSHKTHVKHAAAKPKIQSQRAIDDSRALQIQTALIRAGYLSGSPTGHWDMESQAAMQKLQGDNGWQTKIVPDSRALIKLGLGASASPVGTAPSNPSSSPAS